MKNKMLFGFHAGTSRLRHEAQSVEEIFVDAERNDARMKALIASAKEAGVRVMPVETGSFAGPDMSERDQKRWDGYDDKTRFDIQQMREYSKRKKDMQPGEEGYPVGDFFRSGDVATGLFD